MSSRTRISAAPAAKPRALSDIPTVGDLNSPDAPPPVASFVTAVSRVADRYRPNPRGEAMRANARGEATRELILVTAERLFAEGGIAAVPLREIAITAGQRNKAAIQYHFGDKENLVNVVAAHRAQFVSDTRNDFLAALAVGNERPQLADYVRSFVGPLASNLIEGNYYVPFLSRYYIERGGSLGLESVVPPETVHGLRAIARHLVPSLPEAIQRERWEFLITSAVHTLARFQNALETGTLGAPLEDLVEDLIGVLTAGLES